MGINNHLGLILEIVISILDLQLNSGQIPIASQRETLHNPLGLQRNQLELKPQWEQLSLLEVVRQVKVLIPRQPDQVVRVLAEEVHPVALVLDLKVADHKV